MTTVTTRDSGAKNRAIADAANAYTQAVMSGTALNAEQHRIAAAEMERSAHAALSPAEAAQLDAEIAAAETAPEVTAGQAGTARAQARADLQAWLDAETEAEAG